MDGLDSPPAAAAPEPERVHLHMLIDARSVSLALIALAISVFCVALGQRSALWQLCSTSCRTSVRL